MLELTYFFLEVFNDCYFFALGHVVYFSSLKSRSYFVTSVISFVFIQHTSINTYTNRKGLNKLTCKYTYNKVMFSFEFILY